MSCHLGVRVTVVWAIGIVAGVIQLYLLSPYLPATVQVLRRDNRQGFKAGALVEGLTQLEGQGFE